MNDSLSKELPLSSGVHQGSALGSILYLTYTLPLGDILAKHKLHCQIDADANLKLSNISFRLLRILIAVCKILLYV